MDFLWNKVILIILCFFAQLQYEISIYLILPILVSLIISLSHDLFTMINQMVFIAVYCLIALLYPPFLCYLPLMVYDTYTKNMSYLFLPYVVVFLYHIQFERGMWQWITLLFCGIACILKHQQLRHDALLTTYRLQRDATKEVTFLLEEKNQDLIIQQNYEIQVATLDERNRIAREIHDNVGHLLSSSLLQVGALQTIAKEENLKTSLSTLRTTLSTAMDAVRMSVHNLHEDAIRLDLELQKIIKEFRFCEVTLTYHIDSVLPKELKYHILAIVKEALHNIAKHSNASSADILLREQPSFYQLVIEDNGTNISTTKKGIGLLNIQQRIAIYRGYVNIQNEKGFRIFITIPKEVIQ